MVPRSRTLKLISREPANGFRERKGIYRSRVTAIARTGRLPVPDQTPAGERAGAGMKKGTQTLCEPKVPAHLIVAFVRRTRWVDRFAGAGDMNDLTTQDTLELEVADFGPIVEAKVDLRPLTVFVGPSNTGKSYMAILIYALHRYFSNGDHGYPFHRLLESTERTLPEKAIDDLFEWAEQEFVVRQKTRFSLPGSVTKSIQSMFDIQGDSLIRELCRCFGSRIDQLIRKGSRLEDCITVQRQLSNGLFRFEIGLKQKSREQQLRSAVPDNLEIEIDRRKISFHTLERLLLLRKSRYDETEVKILFWSLVDLVLPHLVGVLHLPAFYLPADRTGVMHAHSVVVSALIESAAMTGLRPAARTPMLSGVLADFLEQLIELDTPSYRRGKSRDDYGARIEDAILHGSVLVEKAKTSGHPHFTYRPKGWKDSLPLMNASSMVSELAPVVLYLRHRIEPGNVLIVEEPESHLHPAMQVEFIRQLAVLVRSGIRVIVTTHSEWVLEELANIVQRYELPEKGRKELSVSDVALHREQVGVWLFKPKTRPKGSVVKEICLDNSGLYPSGFDEVAIALHNDWAKISSSQVGEAE